jgi:diguanylate cyclase (GGDEF)-like protein/putative nucleotidyltransferase with HDIG domain
MSDFKQLPTTAKGFIALVVCGGALVLGQSIRALYLNPIDPQWFLFAGLTLLTGSFTVKVPGINASLSVSETFVFASVLLFGAPAGAVTVLLECLIILFWMKPGRYVHKILFNTAAPAIAIWTSGTVFFAISGIEPYIGQSALVPLRVLFIPLLAFTLLYFLLNSWLVAVALGFETDRSPVAIWWNNFTWLAVNYFSGASVAALIVTYMRDDDISTLAIIVPLLVVSYLTFRTAMGRVEDSNRHLNELNRLYLSTIETLAMAIDAKDQITHGHIRRVQSYAVGLARHLGVGDKRLIQAIEAAALLHDMGKLAVPEYILNKPGKLTTAEFDKMKLHASVGADILSAIQFPYPVVPIVRHHHENWDGSGYPAGLKGTDIPVGARILSVVDCFDALTSDRPYRPRLSDSDALKILIDRRGSMYDPLVVDAFIRVHGDIASDGHPSALANHAFDEITGSTQPTISTDSPRLDEITASTDEMLTLYDLAQGLSSSKDSTASADFIANHLRRLIPFVQFVFFVYDPVTDGLEVVHANGHVSSLVKGLRIPLGQRLSGWVAANRQTILNSDPTLDLGEIARTSIPRLRSCLSTHVVCEGQLIGVLSLYAELPNPFHDNHRRILESVAQHVGHALIPSAPSSVADRTDSVTGLPRFATETDIREQLLDVAGDRSFIFIDIVDFGRVKTEYGRHVADEILRHVAKHAKANLKPGDALFRHNSDTFVAIVHDADLAAATIIAERIREHVQDSRLLPKDSVSLSVDVQFACVAAPIDGRSVAELVAMAESRLSGRRGQSVPRIH